MRPLVERDLLAGHAGVKRSARRCNARSSRVADATGHNCPTASVLLRSASPFKRTLEKGGKKSYPTNMITGASLAGIAD